MAFLHSLALAALLAAVALPATAGAGQPPPVRAAIADLAGRLGVPDTAIRVLTREEVTWPNGAIGCPEPDRAYIQRLINGSRLILAHGERKYAYHAGPAGDYHYCPDPSGGTPPADRSL